MTVPFFTYTITIEKQKRVKGTKAKDPRYEEQTPDQEWFIEKMTYLSKF